MENLVAETSPSSSDGTEGCVDVADLDQLCSKCKAIDFQAAFALTSVQVGRTGKAITKTTKGFDASCALCSWISSELARDAALVGGEISKSEIKYHLRALDSLCVLESRRTSKSRAASPSVVLAVFPGLSGKAVTREEMNKAISKSLLVPSLQTCCLAGSSMSKYLYEGRSVSAKHPDFALMASWIEDCSKHNGYCKRNPSKIHFRTRVIDCWTRKIVPLTEGSVYLALSYVWGKGTQDLAMQQEMQDGDLPSSVPHTIEDALFVVRQLGRRYLWVDRYCIWTSEDKHTQIQNMNHIYQGALTTIVALHSENAASGLPGVSLSRNEQFRLQTNVGMVVSTFPHLSYQIFRSSWATRGWTYQEALLSQSCIFFSGDQVYFACKQNLESEAVRQSGSGRQLEALAPRLLNYDEHLRFKMANVNTSVFHEHIKAYTRRSLSFDSDALNAFRGIIATGGAYTYWGIPFTLREPGGLYDQYAAAGKAEYVFARNLTWRGKGTPPEGENLRRRAGFPTWSWTSMVDQIETEDSFILNVQCSKFYVEKGSELTRIRAICERASKISCLTIPEFGTAIVVEGRVAEVYLKLGDTNGLYDVYAHSSLVADRPQVEIPLTRIFEYAVIDGDDLDVLSKVSHQAWQAVELYWDYKGSGSVWMLIDFRGQIARRIGIIDDTWDNGDNGDPVFRMRDLPAKTMKVRIE